MSNIKSEALASKKDVFQKKCIPKKSLELTGKELRVRVSFTMKVPASWIKLKFYVHIVSARDVFQ